MSRATGLIKRVAAAIKKVGPMSRASYLRVVTLTGGDELIGRDGTITNLDTLFSPQPIYHQLGHRQAMFLSTPTKRLVADDYKFIFPTTVNSETDFQGANTYLVLKDVNGEERFEIIYINSEPFQGLDIVIAVFARSIGYVDVDPLTSLLTEDGDFLAQEDGFAILTES